MKRWTFAVLFLGSVFLTLNCENSLSTQADLTSSETDAITAEEIYAMTYEEVDSTEMEGLIFLREEEKLARDVYLTLYVQWGQKIFNNIAASEQTHTDAIKILLDKYEIEDPVQNDSVGVFTNTILADLYTTLAAQGNSSLVEALKVGALIEEIDIRDLVVEIEENTDNEDIKLVYSNLYKGSRNHLRSFNRNLINQGVDYTPQVLDTETFESIINSAMETGRN